jgi:hypothetical protein
MTVHRPIPERIAALAPRLSPLVAKLGSPHEGEVVAAARAIGRLIERHGLGWNDLGRAIAAEPVVRVVYRDHEPETEPDPEAEDWREMADFCSRREALLTEREAAFVADMVRILRRAGTTPTERQSAWLAAIFYRLQEEAP